MLSDVLQTLVRNYCFPDSILSGEQPNVGKTLPFKKKKNASCYLLALTAYISCWEVNMLTK